MKEHIIRLMPGEDLILSLESYCRKFDIEAAYIGTGVGSFAQLTFRKGHLQEHVSFTGIYELVSLVGTLSKGGMHLHGSLSDEEYKVFGGHLVRGCLVKATAEIVIIELEEYTLTRSKDNMTGYKGLKITPNLKECDNR